MNPISQGGTLLGDFLFRGRSVVLILIHSVIFLFPMHYVLCTILVCRILRVKFTGRIGMSLGDSFDDPQRQSNSRSRKESIDGCRIWHDRNG
ncbi:MAG TPA: hypothetical protein DGU45_05485 [Planctomycetes bacterium]|nr:hypothetical protein [Planctomycetota bacterium]